MKYILLNIFFVVNVTLFAQEMYMYKDEYKVKVRDGEDLFVNNVYGPSATTLEAFLRVKTPPNFPKMDRVNSIAELDALISRLRLETPDAVSKMKRFIAEHYNKAEVIPAILEFASHYYGQNDYNTAIEYYDKISNTEALSVLEQSEYGFKKGYSYFINKKFPQAISEFVKVKEFRNDYFYTNNYYYGMCQYFTNDYEGAIESFKRAAGSPTYESQIPYYISQIYFAQSKYDNLIVYGEQKIKDKNTENKTEIRLLLGQTYYIKQDYIKALEHLEYYEANTSKLTAEEFYQLAFTQYKLSRCDKAKKNFLELTGLESKMGQLSNYYLADCLIKEGDKVSAKSALKKVMAMSYDKNMKEEAAFNYGKLSSELGNEREGINILVNITEGTKYYDESQEIINNILVNSSDYANSIKIVESLTKTTPKIKKTYQALALKHALLLLEEGNKQGATEYLNKSLKYDLDRNYKAQAIFWKGYLSHQDGDFASSLKLMDEFLEISNGLSDLPEASSPYMAQYVKGYIHLKQKDYAKAALDFKNAIVGINIARESMKTDYILNRVLPDAFIRTGDCLFKTKDYPNSKKFYDQAISRKQGGYVYALYQRGLIEGLMGDQDDKIETMTEIISKHGKSEYGDDAYLQLGDAVFAQGNFDKAAVYYIDLINNFGDKSEFYNTAHLKLGLINFNKGDIENAMFYYKKILASNPTASEKKEAFAAIQEIYIDKYANPTGYLNLLDSLGFKSEGLSRDSLSYNLAYSVFENAEYAKAVSAFDGYLNNYPAGYYANDARYYRAESNNVLKLYQKSFADYETIINANNGKYYNKSVFKAALIAYNYTQDFEKALKYYKLDESLTEDAGGKFQAQLGALRSAFKLDREIDVLAYGAKVNENIAATKEEKAAANYYLAKTYFKQGSLEAAKTSYMQVDNLVNNSQAAEARYQVAEILFKQNNLSEAETQCETANSKNNSYPFWIAKGLILLSDIYLKKGDLLNSRAAIEAVIENFKDDQSLLAIAKSKLEIIKVKESESSRIKTKSNTLEVITPKKKN
jgi:tetratricopeptide (TPR) repeat protein